MEAALKQVARGRSFEAMSLRKLAQSVDIVPTAFYRHFESMEALGLALVDECLRTLRRMMREARERELPDSQILRDSVETYFRYVQANRLHFTFIMRERYGGVAALRHAIRAGIALFVSELATDLGRFPGLTRWTSEDLRMIAGLIVSTVTEATESVLEADGHHPEQVDLELALTEKKLRLVLLAVPHWRSG
jgi:AcrR family transcriptional regulator